MDSIELKFNNTWGARLKEPFFNKVEQESKEGKTPAIYCLQEVFSTTDPTREDAWGEPEGELKPRVKAQLWPPPQANQFNRLQAIIGETHRGYFRENKKGNPYPDLPVPPIDYELSFGDATFVRNDIPVKQEGKVGIIRQIEDDGTEEFADKRGTLQWLQVDINGKNIVVAQFHGLRSSQGKGDTPERIRQSESVRRFVDEKIKEGFEVILCRDFNLYPDTRSMGILVEGLGEEEGTDDRDKQGKLNLRNLVTEYGIKTTRNKYSRIPTELSDYILVSQGIAVDEFEVEDDSEISDHLPLILKFH